MLHYHEQDVEKRETYRKSWHQEAVCQLSACDVIFLDPDNGLETKTFKPFKDGSEKYVMHDEACDYFKHGKSVIIYNHHPKFKTKENITHMVNKYRKLLSFSDFSHSVVKCLTYNDRDFLCILHE